MAKKPTASDFQAHVNTFHGFLSMTKFAVIVLAFLVVALFSIIFGGQPWFGVFLLVIAAPVAFFVNRMTGAGG